MIERDEPSARPVRFRDGSGENGVERRITELFRAVEAPEPLSPAELARVRARFARRPLRAGFELRRHEIKLAFVMLMLGAGVAFAGLGAAWSIAALRDRWEAQEDVARAAKAAPNVRARARPARREAGNAIVVPAPASATAKTPESAVTAGRSGTGTAVRASAPAPAVAGTALDSAPGALALESAALARALVKLRRERDPQGALLELDAYAAEFPNGALNLEARVARVDALLALGRKNDALRVLTELPLERVGRGSELLLVRAELRAERDCQSAISDFDRLLSSASAQGVLESALHGRAACRLTLGDRSGAVADLRAYVSRYPVGRFADEVRAHLARLDSEQE